MNKMQENEDNGGYLLALPVLFYNIDHNRQIWYICVGLQSPL